MAPADSSDQCPQLFPVVLFVSVGALCFLLIVTEWLAQRRLARFAAATAAFAFVCFVLNQFWSRYAIRVDLLLTIPFASLAALIAGALSIHRSPVAVRIVGLLLVVSGSVSFSWFAWSFTNSLVDSHRLMALRAADDFAISE
jgi:hypothetical protein